MHANQRNFINYWQSSSAKKIQDRNICEDESIWSDPDISNNLNIDQTKSQKTNTLSKSILDENNQNQQIQERSLPFDKQNNMEQCINNLSNVNELRKQKHSFNNSTYLHDQNESSFQNKNQLQIAENEGYALNANIQSQALINDCQIQSFKNAIGKFGNMRIKLAYFLKNFTSIKRNQNLNSVIRYHINDLSDNLQQMDSNLYFLFCYQIQRLQKLIDLPLIDPQTRLGFGIKMFLSFLNLIYLYLLSLFIVFQIQGPLIQLSDYIIFTLWIIEVVLNLNQKVYLFSVQLQNRKEITLFYLKNKAFYDFIPLLIIFVSLKTEMGVIYQILKFLKIKNLVQDILEIQMQLCMKLVNLIIKLFFLAHFISLLWYLLGQVELKYLQEQVTWYDESIGSDGTWWKLYLAAMYWSLTLMATGSNESHTVLQTFFTTFTMLFTNIAFAYILNVIAIILSGMEQGEEDKRKDVSIINDYMRKRHISNNLKAKVNLNLEHYYKKNFKQEEIQNMEILEKISADLKESLIIEYNKKILNKIQFLQSVFSPDTIEQASLTLKEQYFFPNQIIKFEKDLNDFFLIYVVEGKIESHFCGSQSNRNQHVKSQFKKGEIVGQYSFFTGIQNNMYLKSADFTKIMVLSRNSFINIIKKSLIEFEKYNEVKDQLLLYNQYQIVNLRCDICRRSSHFTIFCPSIRMNKQTIYQQIHHLDKQIQERADFERKIQVRGNSLSVQKSIKSVAKDFVNQIAESDNVIEEDSFQNNMASQGETQNTKTEELDDQAHSHIISKQSYDEQINLVNDTSQILKSILNINNTIQKNESKIHQKLCSDFNEEIQLKFFQQELFQVETKCFSKNDFQLLEKQQFETMTSRKSLKEKFQRNPSIEKDFPNQKTRKDNSDIYAFKSELNEDEDIEISQKFIKKKTHLAKNTSKNSIKYLDHMSNTLTDSQNQQQPIQKFNTLLREILDLITQQQNCSLQTQINQNQRGYNSAQNTQDFSQIDKQNPFLFESLKDYLYYFPQGNSKILIPKYQKNQQKKAKTLKRQAKSLKVQTHLTFSH